MIEFKADCGHTVRAKDEDAGKVVRCAYCGREAQVPQDEADDFDSFFADIAVDNDAHEPVTQSSQRSRKRKPGAVVRPHSRKAVDPFNVVTKMAYVAVILIAVIFVGKKYAWPFVSDTFFGPTTHPTTTEGVVQRSRKAKRRPKPVRPKPSPKKYGLLEPQLQLRGRQGIYVNAVPHDVAVFYRPQAADSSGYQWLDDPTVKRIRGPSYTVDSPAGSYDVVVMLPVNDRQLKRFRSFGYSEFRTRVENAKSKEADKVAAAYFRPDGAQAVLILRMRDRINVIRHYQVTVRDSEWSVLTPLFIPLACPMRAVAKIVPQDVATYRFDSDDIRDELTYYHVEQEDQTYILDILQRIGSISYHVVPPDAHGSDPYPFRLFRISPVDGIFTARYLPGSERKPFRHARRP